MAADIGLKLTAPVNPLTAIAAKAAPIVARVLLGGMFFVAGLDGFLHFMPLPTEPAPEAAMAFGGAMMSTGYFAELVAGTELACGAALLAGRFVPLALIVLAPVLVNIFFFHAFLTPGVANLVQPLAFIALALFLAWTKRDAFRPLLRSRA